MITTSLLFSCLKVILVERLRDYCFLIAYVTLAVTNVSGKLDYSEQTTKNRFLS